MPDIIVLIVGIVGLVVLIGLAVYVHFDTRVSEPSPLICFSTTDDKPFSVAEYYERMEKAAIDIEKKREPLDGTIILWLVIDGLRMDENGELEWIKREEKKPDPVNQNVFYQPCQGLNQAPAFSYTLYADSIAIESVPV